MEKIPTDKEITDFAISAITNDGKVELSEHGKLLVQLVEQGAKWMRHELTGIPEYQHRIKSLFE